MRMAHKFRVTLCCPDLRELYFFTEKSAANTISMPSLPGWRKPTEPSPAGRAAWKPCPDALTASGENRQLDLHKRTKGRSGQVLETPQPQRPCDCRGRGPTTGVARALVSRRERCNACRQFGVCVADAMWSSFRTRAQVCCWRREFHLEQATPRTSLAADYLQ